MFAMLLGIPCVFSSFYRLFYARKNRFYVTNNDIGFEYRHWFGIQKGFFRFGEVRLALSHLPASLYFDTSKNILLFIQLILLINL